MKNKEVVNRNISLTFDFLREIVKNPSLIDDISDGTTIEFIEKDRSIPEHEEAKRADKFYKVRHEFDSI